MTNSKHDKSLDLTPEERDSIERDRLLMNTVKEVNSNSAPPAHTSDSQIQATEVAYWASLGNVGRVKNALATGCDVNDTDEIGYTALHAAALNGHFDIVKLLVEHGAQPTAKIDSGETPLDLARQVDQIEIVAFLEETGGG